MKSKRTALLTAGLTVLLCAAIIVGATFALFGTQKQREVTVTTGSVDIAAEFDADSLTLYSLTPESTDAQPTGSLNFATGGSASIDGQNGSISLSQMVPGDKAEFTLTITNTGKSAARFRVDYTPSVTGAEGAEDSLNYAITAHFRSGPGRKRRSRPEVPSRSRSPWSSIKTPNRPSGTTARRRTSSRTLPSSSRSMRVRRTHPTPI